MLCKVVTLLIGFVTPVLSTVFMAHYTLLFSLTEPDSHTKVWLCETTCLVSLSQTHAFM